jgi:L1 cell adhesion molecule like protein
MIGSTMDDEKVIADVKHFPFTVITGEGSKPVIQVDYQGEKKQFSPEEISAMVLTRMKETAEAFLGTEVSKAVVTVPAYFNDSQRVATRNAGTIAGLEVKRIINEPTAAALAYGLDSGDIKGKDVKVLVFDLGGGTFDVSLLRIEGGIFEVLGTGGDTHLGGEDFDQNLVDFLATEFNRKNRGKDVTTNPRAMKRLKSQAERAKRVLSSATVTHVEIEDLLEGCDLSISLSRAKFEELNKEPFNRCMDTVKNVMKEAKMGITEVDEIVLVGGSTRIPKIQGNLVKFFEGKELNKSINPDEAVAYGAAVQGAILSGVKDPAHSALLLVDVTPLSLGIEMSGRIMSTLIKRNTAIPVRRTKTYTTEEDYQERVDIPIFEGERACTDGNNKLGDFTITGIQRAKRGVPQIEVTFDLDANGILNVSARDTVTMASANITISNEKGRLSEEEIEKMVSEAEKYKALDAAHSARVEARNELDRLVYNVMESAKANKNLAMISKVQDVREWLDTNPNANAIELEERRADLERQAYRK